MKLTHRSEYALLALLVLARNYGSQLVSGENLSQEQGIPKRFLQQILMSLKRGGFVRATKGQDGGYALAKAPEDITLAAIVRSIEGPLAATTSVSKNFYYPSPIEKEKSLVRLFSEIRDYVSQVLESTTLADMIDSPQKSRSLKKKLAKKK